MSLHPAGWRGPALCRFVSSVDVRPFLLLICDVWFAIYLYCTLFFSVCAAPFLTTNIFHERLLSPLPHVILIECFPFSGSGRFCVYIPKGIFHIYRNLYICIYASFCNRRSPKLYFVMRRRNHLNVGLIMWLCHLYHGDTSPC